MKLYTLQQILVFSIAILIGWMLHDVSSLSSFGMTELPSSITGLIVQEDTSHINYISEERFSPSDIISEEHIRVQEDRIIIMVDNPQWAMFTNTNSMDPVFDEGSHALQIVPTSSEDISVGDIISYETTDNTNRVIIHRVVEIGQDKEGWYAVTKGDNNPIEDPEKVRFIQVKKLLIGIIY